MKNRQPSPVRRIDDMADKYAMDGHKMIWHLDRVLDWEKGHRIAPLHIDVGLSKGCNIKCQYCFGVLQGNFYRKGADTFFPREALLSYVREAGEAGVRSMAFIGEGEPLLNPHVYDAIVEGTKAGVDIALGTNGLLLDTGLPGERALECLKWIRFNISAATDDAYRRVHGSKDFAVAKEKISFCVEQKRKKGLSVTVGLQMVLTPSNVDQVLLLAELGKELGVDYLVVKQCSDTVANDLKVYDRLGEYEHFNEILQKAEALSTDSYNVIVKWGKITNNGVRNYDQCLGVPFLLYSSGDGKLYPCGMFFDHEEETYRLGDLTTQSFKEILQSERYWQVVEKVASLNVHECYSNCRTHAINDFLAKLRNPPEHVNFV
jgi:MoaA/NifB/PqqE/SkfB family radical SAM enzyme